MWKMYDFYCEPCEKRFEVLVTSGTTHQVCPGCGGAAERVMSSPAIGTINDPNIRSEMLRKRSEKHSFAEARRNPERLTSMLGGRPRVQNPWNVRKQKSSQ